MNDSLKYTQVDDILVVIVLYKMSLEDSSTFKTINQALEIIDSNITMVVYDNSPIANYNSLKFKMNRCFVIYRSDVCNSGLSAAYNWASEIAFEMNIPYLLLFDQDSHLPIDYFSNLLNIMHDFRSEHLFVPILKESNLYLSPCRFVLAKGFSWIPKVTGVIPIKGKSIFNSGICIKNSVYRELGGYNEDIPLDFSDHYFISKYKKIYSTFVLVPSVVTHSLSSFILDKNKQMTRFKIYCMGTKKYGKLTHNIGLLSFWNFLRAIKLSVLFGDFVFVSIYFHFFVNNENK